MILTLSSHVIGCVVTLQTPIVGVIRLCNRGIIKLEYYCLILDAISSFISMGRPKCLDALIFSYDGGLTRFINT